MPLQEDDRGMPLQEDDRGRLIVARFRWLQEIVGDQIHAASAAVLEKIPQDSEVVFAVLDVSLDLNLNEGLREQVMITPFLQLYLALHGFEGTSFCITHDIMT
jgi:hypothetical protein